MDGSLVHGLFPPLLSFSSTSNISSHVQHLDSLSCIEEIMGPRWKGKGSEKIAASEPMSKIVDDLQSTLLQLGTHGLLLGSGVIVEATVELTHLLNRACFGRPIITSDVDNHWFQLNLEEAFYLSHELRCLKLVANCNESKCPKNEDELWQYMKSKNTSFPEFYKAYSHLRKKNWVVRSGSQYGVDFVAYHHHPALVHAAFAVLVLSESENYENHRLKVWSDFHSTVRLCGSVAKTLLVLNINKTDYDANSPLCLEKLIVDEHTITRWSPECCREDQTTENESTRQASV